MPNVTLSLPADLRQTMDQFKEINWSEVARQAIRDKVRALQAMDRLLRRSTLTDADVAREARLIKKRVWRRRRR